MMTDQDPNGGVLGADQRKQPTYSCGWMCPRCSTVHAWWVARCDCLPPTMTATSTGIAKGVIGPPARWE